MYPLYPAIKPYQCHELPVGEPHVLYVEETGNPNGLPVIILHSGPGAGGDTHLRRFFDPEIYRIIYFDQRGCGRSIPHGDIRDNTTSLLIADIETIRNYLGLNKIMLFGGGWGALLALLYAEQYPEWVSGLLLHRLFLGRKQDTDWLYKQGANRIFPDYWQEFIAPVPLKKQQQIPAYYAHCLQGDNELARMAAAKNWALWQARCSSLQSHAQLLEEYSEPHFALALAMLETHYISHHFFITDNQVLDNAHRIKHLPVYLVHGRYDMVCPLASAWDLHQTLPESNLSIVREAGHSLYETAMIDALITISKQLTRVGLDVS